MSSEETIPLPLAFPRALKEPFGDMQEARGMADLCGPRDHKGTRGSI